jgi:hypothetical protein
MLVDTEKHIWPSFVFVSDLVSACWHVEMTPIAVEFPSINCFHKGIREGY